MKIKRRGFTLVEVLIVVIIIAILAALILPRMMSQTGRAEVAEAQQMLGAIRRAQATYADINGLGNSILPLTIGAADANWGLIGVTNPNNVAGHKFNYTCDAALLVCAATSTIDAAVGAGGTINITAAGTGFGCGGAAGHAYAQAGATAASGCRPAR